MPEYVGVRDEHAKPDPLLHVAKTLDNVSGPETLCGRPTAGMNSTGVQPEWSPEHPEYKGCPECWPKWEEIQEAAEDEVVSYVD